MKRSEAVSMPLSPQDNQPDRDSVEALFKVPFGKYNDFNHFEGAKNFIVEYDKNSENMPDNVAPLIKKNLKESDFSIFKNDGGKLVAVALLLFAFSTAITWCYYGDRSTAYIFGERGVIWYRNLYVLCFILAAVIDTTIVWNIAYVVVALVSIPNLIALFVLRKEMRDLTKEFSVNN